MDKRCRKEFLTTEKMSNVIKLTELMNKRDSENDTLIQEFRIDFPVNEFESTIHTAKPKDGGKD